MPFYKHRLFLAQVFRQADEFVCRLFVPIGQTSGTNPVLLMGPRNITNQPRQSFLPHPSATWAERSPRCRQLGVATDADVSGQGIRSSDQLWQAGEGSSRVTSGVVVAASIK